MCIEIDDSYSLSSLNCTGVANRFPAGFQGWWKVLEGTWVLLSWACSHRTSEGAWWYMCLLNTEVILTADLAWGKRRWIVAYGEDMSSPRGISVGSLELWCGDPGSSGSEVCLRIVFPWSSVDWVLGYNVCLLHERGLSKAEHQTGEWGVLEWLSTQDNATQWVLSWGGGTS